MSQYNQGEENPMSESESPFVNLTAPLDKLRGPAGCEVIDGCIVLDGTYSIELRRCDTPAKILGWIEQLGDRPRFQPLLRAFVLTAVQENGLEIHYGM